MHDQFEHKQQAWSARFSEPVSALVQRYTASVDFDQRLALFDVAGSIAAMRRTRCRVVTVAVNSFVFLQPITTQYLVSFYSRVARVGTTSITVDVDVYAETGYDSVKILKVASAQLTYVAVNEDGSKRLIAPEQS